MQTTGGALSTAAVTISAVIQAVAAIVMAIFTVFLVVYGKRGWVVSKQAADAAQKSVEIAERTLRLTERADVVLEGIAVDTVAGDLISDSTVLVQFKNCGRTRANDVVFAGAVGLSEEVLQPKQMGAPAIIAAGDSAPFSFDEPLWKQLPPNIFADINQGKALLRIRGILTYRDVFQESHRLVFEGAWNTQASTFDIRRIEAD